MVKIEEYPNYFVDELGNVFNEKGMMNKNITKQGYIFSSLTKNKKRKFILNHRIVAKAFIPNPHNKPEVNHINCIKSDNRVENLEWCTNAENVAHATKLGLNKKPTGIDSTSSKRVKQISLIDNSIIKIWDSLHCVTNELGFNFKNISACALGKRPTAYGFKWKY